MQQNYGPSLLINPDFSSNIYIFPKIKMIYGSWLTHILKKGQTDSISCFPSWMLWLALFSLHKSNQFNHWSTLLGFDSGFIVVAIRRLKKKKKMGCESCDSIAQVLLLLLLLGACLCLKEESSTTQILSSAKKDRVVSLNKEENPWKPRAQIRRIQYQCSYSWRTRQTGHLLHTPTCQDWHCSRNWHWVWPSCGSSSWHGCSPSAGTHSSFELDWEFGWMVLFWFAFMVFRSLLSGSIRARLMGKCMGAATMPTPLCCSVLPSCLIKGSINLRLESL